jgi:Arc/MetJ-type ribon-helix-helix transcriptional regulator
MEEKNSDRMTVRLPKETLSLMDTMLHVYGFQNRSEFVRVAVEEYIERRKIGLVVPQKEVEEIKIALAPVASASLEYLIRLGYYRPETIHGIFSDVVAKWIYEKLDELEGKKPVEVASFIQKIHKKDEDVRRYVRE